jgi:hypothetical protein
MKFNTVITKEGAKELERRGFTIGSEDVYAIEGVADKTYTLVGVLETAEHGTEGVRLLLHETGAPVDQGVHPVLIAYVILKSRATVAA